LRANLVPSAILSLNVIKINFFQRYKRGAETSDRNLIEEDTRRPKFVFEYSQTAKIIALKNRGNITQQTLIVSVLLGLLIKI